MNCTRFEGDLRRILDAERAAPDRDAVLQNLARHARDCPDCHGALDLVDLLALPEGERDVVDDPGPLYWSVFNERVGRRIRAADRAAGARRIAWAAAAAVLVLVGVAAWRSWSGARATPGAEVPAALARAIEDHPLEATLDVLDGLGSMEPDWADAVGSPGAAASLEPDAFGLPDLAELDPSMRRELLAWLEERTARLAEERS
jgi:hypothetical protein